jgi:hypothetical protein
MRAPLFFPPPYFNVQLCKNTGFGFKETESECLESSFDKFAGEEKSLLS